MAYQILLRQDKRFLLRQDKRFLLTCGSRAGIVGAKVRGQRGLLKGGLGRGLRALTSGIKRSNRGSNRARSGAGSLAGG